jgi:hypothetical protein
MSRLVECPDWDAHDFAEVYYGYQCKTCGLFFAFGCEPWLDEWEQADAIAEFSEAQEA